MPRNEPSRLSPGIYKQTLPSGKISWLVFLGRDTGGKQRWKRFDDLNDAETHQEQLAVAKHNEGQQIWSLTPEQRSEAARCYKLLQAYPDASLTDAAKQYIDRLLIRRGSVTVKEAVNKLVQRAEMNRRSKRTVTDLRNRLDRFAGMYGDRPISEITVEQLQAFLHNPAHAPGTFINYRTKLRQLWRYAKREGWVAEDIVEKIDVPTREAEEVGVFTPSEAAALLEHADEFGMLPFIAIGLFAGIRSCELGRLDWSQVNFEERSITVLAHVARKRRRRIVTINDTLAAWIAPCVKTNGPVAPPDPEHRLKDVARAAGVEWKQNGLRHSFGSYHLSMWSDAAKTAFEMGHRDPRVTYNHYVKAVRRSEAERYWALRPASVESKVIPLPTAG